MKKTILTFIAIFCGLILSAQNIDDVNPKLLKELWAAKWITHPSIEGDETGVYLFKKVLTFKAVPKDFVINISADNRYVFYVNGVVISRGPARCDFNRWLFDTVDIAPYLKVGENHIAVKVWNMAQLKPVAQMTLETGLIIQGNTENEKEINTNKSWSVVADEAYSFYKIKDLRRFYASGPGEKFRGNIHPWDWKTAKAKVTWKTAKEGKSGMPMNYYNITGKTDKRLLCPRSIPMMEAKMQNFAKVRRIEGVKSAKNLITGKKTVKIPANTTAVILLDQGHLTNAYPQLKYSQGAKSTIKITYAESLFVPKDGKPTFEKGNRNEVEGKVMWGNYDIVEVDGGEDRLFEPLWWRCFRYVELEITTDKEPLVLEEFHSEFTGYPFELKSSFESKDSGMSDIFEVAWRTQRLCAGELFFDCPYYEQLQYTGDTRIQGLNTAYASGDTRLWKDAIQDYYDSRLPFGLTQSRYPSSTQQIIAPFSLVWITMLHDYMMHCEDHQFIEKMVPAILDILNWYDARVADNGMLGNLESWLFVDWVNEWKTGYPPLTKEKEYSAVIGMQYVYTIQKAMEIFDAYGMSGLKNKWSKKAEITQKSILEHCWDEDKQLLADTPEKKTYSQHSNVLAILSNSFEVAQEKELMQRVFINKDIAQTSFYFDFYKIAALKKVGLGDVYLSTLDTLSGLLDKGLTTFPEKADPTRSDCHAWSASPLYYYLSLICGIEPATPGFNSIRIEPHLGDLNWVKGSMPHRLGEIKVNLKKTRDKKIIGSIYLPEKLTGTYVQNGNEISLKSGENKID